MIHVGAKCAVCGRETVIELTSAQLGLLDQSKAEVRAAARAHAKKTGHPMAPVMISGDQAS